MNIQSHDKALTAAQKLVRDNPELHAEYTRRKNAGEWFKEGEAVTEFQRKLIALNKAALKAVGI